MIATAAIAALLACATAQPTLEYVGLTRLPDEAEGERGPIEINGLSGVAFAGGDRWIAVCDKGGVVVEFELTTSVGDQPTASVVRAMHLEIAGDYEGISITGDRNLLVADEGSGVLLEFNGETGERVRQVRIERLASGARANLGIESLTRCSDGAYWVATERALGSDAPGDGRVSTSSVRLLHVSNDARSIGEFVYEVDAAHAPAIGGRGVSGLSELVCLENGRLLALERSFVVGPDPFRSRIYLVDTADATDVTLFQSLEVGGYRPVSRSLLWEGASGNLEGLALGPLLEDGSRLLVGVVDDGDPLSQNAVVTFHFRE